MTTEQRRTAATAIVLIAVGVVAMAARLLAMRSAPPPDNGALWQVRYEVQFRSAKPGARIRLALPDNTAGCRIYRESFSRGGLATDVVRNARTQGRSLVVLAPGASREGNLVAEFDVRVDASHRQAPPPRQALDDADRQYYLRPERSIQTDSPVVRKTEAALAKDHPTAAGLLRAIYLHCCTALARDDVAGRSDADGAMTGCLVTPLGRTRAMIALCRVAGLPARPVTGLVLHGHGDDRPVVWAEVHKNGRWVQ